MEGHALISNHEGNTSQQSYYNGPQSSSIELPGNWPGASILLENGSFPYIRLARWNGQQSHLTWKELNPLAMSRMVQPLHLTKWEHIPLSHQNGYSVLTLSVPGNWPGASIPRMAISLTSVLLNRMANTHIWHGRNQSSYHDRMAQPLHLTYSSEWIWIFSTHIWHGRNWILSPWQNGSALTYDHGRNQSSHHVRMAMGLITFPWRKPRYGEHQASP